MRVQRQDEYTILRGMMIAKSLAAAPLVSLEESYWRDRGAFLARQYGAHGAVVRAVIGQTEVVFLLGPEANRFVLQTHRHAFLHRPAWDWVFGRAAEPPNLITIDDPAHARHRRVLNPAFAARCLDGYVPAIERAIRRRLALWATRGTVDVYEEARIITLEVAATAFLGFDTAPELALCRAIFLHGARDRDAAFADLLRSKADARRARPAEDALGLLANGHDEHGRPFGDAQIRAHAEVILIAGHETSASLAAWAFYLLVTHPAYAARVREEIAQGLWDGPSPSEAMQPASALDRALSEAERLYPPVSIVPRVVGTEVAFDGYLLPVGTRVFYSAAATHLLPAIWTRPAEFDPDRFAPPREEHKSVPYALVGFGGGPRICIGRSVARLELALFIARALQRFDLTLVPGQTIAQRSGVTSRPLHGIWLQVRRR